MSEVMTKAEMVENEFLRLYEVYQVANAPDKRKASIIDSFWSDIYETVFKPSNTETIYNNAKSKLKTYDVQEVEEVCEMYIKLCQRYGGVIKINQFSKLTGINSYTFHIWHNANNTNGYIVNLSNKDIDEENKTTIYILKDNNSVDVIYNGNNYRYGDVSKNTKYLSNTRFDILKKLKDEMYDENTNSLENSSIGAALRANNDKEVGKMYDRQRNIDKIDVFKQALGDEKLPQISVTDGQYLLEQS